MDIVDHASKLEEMERSFALKKRMPVLKATGYCYFCNEVLHNSNTLFCDNACRDDYELEQQAIKRNGK